jgi:hypothetical protein
MKTFLAIVFLSLLSTSALAGQSRFWHYYLPYPPNVEYNPASGMCEIELYVEPESTNMYGIRYQASLGYEVSAWIVEGDDTKLLKEETVTAHTRNLLETFRIFVDQVYFRFPPNQSTYIVFELRSNKGRLRLVDSAISAEYICYEP